MFDNGILDLIKSNPEKGMSALMEQYTGLVYTIVKNKVSTVCTSEDIEETVSDVFVTFYKKVNDVDLSKGNLSAYLTTIAKRKAIDKFRSCIKPYEISTDDEQAFLEIPDNYNLEAEAERKMIYRRLIEEINALGEPDRTIIYRKYFLSEGSKAIANHIGISDDSVRKRLSRALQKIQERLKGDYYED